MEFVHQKQVENLLSKLDWNLSPKELLERNTKLMKSVEASVDKILSLPDSEKNFENVVLYSDAVGAGAADLFSSVSFPAYSSTDKKKREASTQANQEFSKFSIELAMNRDLFLAYKAVEEKQEKLDAVEARLLERNLRDFKRNGLELSEGKREKLKNKYEEISKLSIEFQQALNEVDDFEEFSAEELAGIPESSMQQYKKLENGKFKVGITYPEIFPLLDNCIIPETRRKMALLFGNRARDSNSKRLERVLELRDECSKILGYKSHADFTIEVKMAKTPDNVWKFLSEMKERLISLGQKELDEFIALKNAELGEKSDGKFNAWDTRYYIRMNKEKNYNVDPEEVKTYFPTLFVVEKMLQFYQDIFGLDFFELPDVSTWHEDVQAFAICDRETGDFIGVFFLDLYPRPGKFSHAAAFPLIQGRQVKKNGKLSYHNTASAMVCNFPKSTPDTPSLLNHSDVETLYHEFGHIIHQTITKSRFAEFSGSSVSQDFVEAPSQMLENWVWDADILSGITKHYKTGEPVSKDLVDRMIAAKNANVASHYLRQLMFGFYDMNIHDRYSKTTDLVKLWHQTQEDITLITNSLDTFPAASFGHLIGGYDAGYYGYLWSEVIAQDLYTRFKEEGAQSTSAGLDYRRIILEPGNDIPEMELVEKYLKRKTTPEAFIKGLGLKT